MSIAVAPPGDAAVSRLPAAVPSDVVPAVRNEVIRALGGKIPPVRSSPLYTLGLLVVAFTMVLLPLVYLALICGVGWLLYWHVTHNYVIFEHTRNAKAAILGFFGPLVAGVALLFFMVKPLLAPQPKPPARRRLDPAGEPTLFAFVDKVCESIRAPRPREICVDNDVNASASFRRGIWSLFGNDLTLTIGAPLVAGMTLPQFAGVLGHEFGHFSQGLAMRLTYVIRSVNMWFVRVVYERDKWDQELEATAASGDGYAVILAQITRFLIWVSRRILWVLMQIGHGVSCFMLRQMEYDADRHEARLSGSDVFEATCRRLVELSVARQMAFADLNRTMQEGRLADNFPQLMVANVPQIPEEFRRDVFRRDLESKTGWFDTHPANKDRIASARREQAPGLFPRGPLRLAGEQPTNLTLDEVPASILFSDFAGLSRSLTLEFYESALGRGFHGVQLVEVDALLGHQESQAEDRKALARFFQGTFLSLRPLSLPQELTRPASPEEAVAFLSRARAELEPLTLEYRRRLKAYDDADTEALRARSDMAMLETGALEKAREAGLKSINFLEAGAARDAAQATMNELAPQMMPYEELSSQRFATALQLAVEPERMARLPESLEVAPTIHRLYRAARVLGRVVPTITALRDAYSGVASQMRLASEEVSDRFRDAVLERIPRVVDCLANLSNQVDPAIYPFQHAEEGMTLHKFVIPRVPDKTSFSDVLDTAHTALEHFYALYERVYARLARIAEAAEQDAGLAPLPEPPPLTDTAPRA